MASTTVGRTRARTRALAGVLYSLAGFVLLMGILTAEMTYPADRHYSTRQEISDLGATAPPDPIVTQPSAAIFDGTMVVAGVLLLAGAWAAWRYFRHGVLFAVSGLFGLGALLVGVFPGDTAPHPMVAMIAFVFSGVTAITVARVATAPFRLVSAALGVLSLIALAVGELGESSAVAERIGLGGVERWIVYPMILWLALFGGYLLAAHDPRASVTHRPPTVATAPVGSPARR